MRLWYLVGFAAWLCVLGWMGNMEHEDRNAERAHYCEMVKIYEDSNGQFGWPAYDGACDD